MPFAADGNIVSAWGYAQTIASLVIALLMPLLGSMLMFGYFLVYFQSTSGLPIAMTDLGLGLGEYSVQIGRAHV